jgi:uroporphyrinogen decarboxylase
MTPRERVLAAIRHELPDRIPVDAITVENVTDIAAYLGISPDTVIERLGLDGRICSAWLYLGERRTDSHGVALSEWGTYIADDYGTSHHHPLERVSNLAEVERYPWPDPLAYNFADAAELARRDGATYAVRGPYWKPLFCTVCDLFGMEEAMVRMMTEPDLFEAVLERVTVYTEAFCERLLDACGDAVPIFCLGDDFATQRGMMISPERWREFLKPRYARLFTLAKRRGKFVWFHSCGDITSVLPDLIDIGLDVWETVQLHTLPMSPVALKREFGRHITFFGAVSTQRLPFVTPNAVREETLRCIELLGEGGGYICGPDHHVKPDVSPENTLALFDTATAFCAAGYTAGR